MNSNRGDWEKKYRKRFTVYDMQIKSMVQMGNDSENGVCLHPTASNDSQGNQNCVCEPVKHVLTLCSQTYV